MNTTFCTTPLTLAAFVLGLPLFFGAESVGNEPAEKPGRREPTDKKVEAIIKELEKKCLEPPYVYLVGPERAERLAELVRQRRPRLVVECGTALGYSGLWIANELKKTGKGKLITIELSPERAKKAEATFRKAGLDEYITVKVGDARKVVKKIKGPIDFVFIDCGAPNYYPCLKGLQAELSPGAVIVADNIGLSGGGMKDYLDEVRSKYKSRTEWFEGDLPWSKRDALEVSVVPK